MGEIGDKMHERRLELGLTLEDVAKAVGVGKSTVRKWENGMIKNMGRDKIAALARVLHLCPVEFVPTAGDDVPERISKEDLSVLETLHQNPKLGLLFDHTRRMSSQDVDIMLRFAEGILKSMDK